jgi:hypothetical protein
MSEDEPLTPALSPEYRGEGGRRRARRTVVAGLLLILIFGALTFTPLLLGRGSLNRFIVVFSVVGVLLGGSFVLHGLWDWLAAGRGRP